MPRRILFALMLFLVLWTGTFLHDIAEPDEYISFQPASGATSRSCSSLFNANEQASAEEHCHDALVVSRCDQPDNYLSHQQPPLLANTTPRCASLHLLRAPLSTRGPPATIAFAETRLYLLKRALLI
jgi:hypothetical protein